LLLKKKHLLLGWSLCIQAELLTSQTTETYHS
jgi:hypothetical protein